ncbi:hypothetical protein ACOMHN_031548 [Nucella lapillus]
MDSNPGILIIFDRHFDHGEILRNNLEVRHDRADQTSLCLHHPQFAAKRTGELRDVNPRRVEHWAVASGYPPPVLPAALPSDTGQGAVFAFTAWRAGQRYDSWAGWLSPCRQLHRI